MLSANKKDSGMSGTRTTLRRAAAAALLIGATSFGSIAAAEPTVRGRGPDGSVIRVDSQRPDARRGPITVRQDGADGVITSGTGGAVTPFQNNLGEHFCPG
jgi:hypothetical protein